MYCILLFFCVDGSAFLLPEKSAKEVGFNGKYFSSISERERQKLRREAGWPNEWIIPGESDEYRQVQEKRYHEILNMEHMQERLDNIVQHTQTRVVKNFTQLGFQVVDEIAPEIQQRLLERLLKKKDSARPESKKKLQGIYGREIPKFVDFSEHQTVLNAFHNHLQNWSKQELEPVTAYGIRIYQRGSSLAWHADRVDTHVISAIFHIGHHFDNTSSPWPIEIEGHDGKRYAVDLQPGQALFYESAKCPHGRSLPLQGDWYASVFIHFKPKYAWPYTTPDIWLAVPIGWDSPPIYNDRGPGDRWQGAFLTHDSMTVAGMSSSHIISLPNYLRRREQPAPFPNELYNKPKIESAHTKSHNNKATTKKKKNILPILHLFAETVSLFAGVGIFGLIYTLGFFALLSTLGFAARRAWLTRGRSLLRFRHHNKKYDTAAFHCFNN